MRKLIIALALPLALTACDPVGIGVGTAPAPLEKTAIDEKGLIAALQAFDVALTAVDGLVAANVIVPGSPLAIKIKGYLETAQTAFQAAKAAQRAGSATSYAEALAQAQDALVLASAAIKNGE